MHILEREIELGALPEDLWHFIANPANLDTITPPGLRFQIVSALPEEAFDGLLIEYRITIPLLGRRRWLTEIKHIRPGLSFVDEQRLGPYAFWYHYHQITPLGEGRSRMIDRVHYRLPFGAAGELLHRPWVEPMLRRIFDFRERRLTELFL